VLIPVPGRVKKINSNKLTEIKEEIKDFDSPPVRVNKKVMIDAET